MLYKNDNVIPMCQVPSDGKIPIIRTPSNPLPIPGSRYASELPRDSHGC